ncbi:uncharacterized protein PHALS_13312 [Plasmopara halstedii]|uniref:Uncharacterized protein n=1 Tax=Plasmopara halstedii TaxID=4781 RepID=A0A0P1APU0_PLAHL|nr:uncharacterized protein PHALS_13312 [Plasmopara halstedii]CEG43094.1 hypothetical protein PHALS_13312 [Plasmopara halstedii]|eukprot:XP_024579463.1 hypothetical protein PHALS_13312 [Plasmopara halstedii]
MRGCRLVSGLPIKFLIEMPGFLMMFSRSLIHLFCCGSSKQYLTFVVHRGAIKAMGMAFLVQKATALCHNNKHLSYSVFPWAVLFNTAQTEPRIRVRLPPSLQSNSTGSPTVT